MLKVESGEHYAGYTVYITKLYKDLPYRGCTHDPNFIWSTTGKTPESSLERLYIWRDKNIARLQEKIKKIQDEVQTLQTVKFV